MRNSGYVVGVTKDIAEVVLGSHLECKHCGACIAAAGDKQRKLEAVNEKIAQLTEIRESLELLLESCDGGLDSAVHCSIIEALEAGAAKTTRPNEDQATKEATL